MRNWLIASMLLFVIAAPAQRPLEQLVGPLVAGVDLHGAGQLLEGQISRRVALAVASSGEEERRGHPRIGEACRDPATKLGPIAAGAAGTGGCSILAGRAGSGVGVLGWRGSRSAAHAESAMTDDSTSTEHDVREHTTQSLSAYGGTVQGLVSNWPPARCVCSRQSSEQISGPV